jgi:hypothetical protein
LKRIITMAAVAVLLTACNQKPAAPAAPAAGATKFDTNLNVTEIMGHMVDPGAFMYWKTTGEEETVAGIKSLAPTTEEGWETMVSGATIVAEAGNALQLPGRARAPEADWNRYAQQLTAQALVARAAADKHDPKAVFDEGAKLYQVCVACHKQYVIDPIIAENNKNGWPATNPLPDWPADVKAKQKAYEAAAAAKAKP